MGRFNDNAFLDPFIQTEHLRQQRKQRELQERRLKDNESMQGVRMEQMRAQIDRIRQLTANMQRNGGVNPMVDLGNRRLAQHIAEWNYKTEHNLLGGNGVEMQSQRNLLNQILNDNPQLNNDEGMARKALDAYLSRKDTLDNGVQLNAMSPLTQGALNSWTRHQTTAPLITQAVNAQQASAEVNVLEDKIKEYGKDYGATYFNKSPQAMIDSFKNDDASQERLGKLIARQQLTYDLAQMQIRMQQGQSAQAVTQELMHKSGQAIDTNFPKISRKARDAAVTYANKAFKDVMKARQDVGISPAQALVPGMFNSMGAQAESNNMGGESYAEMYTPKDAAVIAAAKKAGTTPEQMAEHLNKVLNNE